MHTCIYTYIYTYIIISASFPHHQYGTFASCRPAATPPLAFKVESRQWPRIVPR